MTLKELTVSTYQMFRPPKPQTVSEWADNNRVLTTVSSAEPGQWRTDRAPYQREIMESFTQPGVWKIVIMASAQVGKTELELNMMGRGIDVDPGPMMFVQPTLDMTEAFSKERVTPMIDACAVLKRKVYSPKARDDGNTIFSKSFPGGRIAFIGANSPSSLASRPVRYLFMDEVDRYPASAGTEGNPAELAERRTETFRHNRKVVMTSTPLIKGSSPIEDAYMDGTQEEWRVECPHCKTYSFINFFSDIKFEHEKYKAGDREDYKVWDIRWKCPACGNLMTEYETKRLPAKWFAKHPEALEKGVRSFRLNAFISPWSDWLEICQKYLHAKGDQERMKTFWNTILGETWEVRDRSGVPEKLYDRREEYLAEVPSGVLVLTMGVDTQDNRMEYEVTGWNQHEESWGISRGVIPHRADTPEAWAEIDALLDHEWKRSGNGAMRILATFIDCGGHCSDAVHAGCVARRARNVFAIKGEGGAGKPYVRLMKTVDGKKIGNESAFIIGVDQGKADIMYATTINEPGPRYMHYPKDYTSGYDPEYFRGLISEKQVFHRRNGRMVAAWEVTHTRNEPLDCRNYARAAYKYFHWKFDDIIEALNGLDRKKDPITKTQAARRKPKRMLSEGIKI